MLFKITKGSIEDHGNLEISCEDVFVMDFGDAKFTSFEASEDWITFFERFPQVDPTKREASSPWYIGKIHSHHSMGAFHSPTDTQDLFDNAPKLPFFLSLVVNYACAPFAEIAIAGEIEQKSVSRHKWSMKNFLGLGEDKIEKKSDKKPITYIIPCDVVYLTQKWILDQIEVIRERNKPKTPVYSYTPPHERLGFHSNRRDGDYIDKSTEKVGSRINNPKGYRLVLEHLTELLVLGQGTTTTFIQPPAVTYELVDDLLLPGTVDKYMSSFNNYFINEWYHDHFSNTTITEEEIITCLRFFTSLDVNRNRWLTKEFNKNTYELEEEIKLLRSVQGDAVV